MVVCLRLSFGREREGLDGSNEGAGPPSHVTHRRDLDIS